MGLLSDALRHLLASDPGERRAGLAGLVGRAFGADPQLVRHPSAPVVEGLDVVHLRKTGGAHPRSYALTVTLGLAETRGSELVAATLADARDPDRDPIAWMLAAARAVPRDGVGELPEGCLGRSSHTRVLVVADFLLPDVDRPEYERIVGAPLDLALPVTAREAEWIGANGAAAFVAALRAQGVAPLADRPAGQTHLTGAPG